MKFNILFIITLSLITVSIVSCHPEHSSENDISNRIKKEIIFDETGLADTVYYNYNSSGQLDMLNNHGTKAPGTYKLEYNSTGKVTKQHRYVDQGMTNELSYKQFTYNADGRITTLEHFVRGQQGFQKVRKLVFDYNGSTLTKVSEYSVNNNIEVLDNVTTYHFEGNNITSFTSEDHTNGTPETTSFNIAYDTKTNYYGQLPQILATDLSYEEGGEADDMPFLLSANNPVSITAASVTQQISYTEDSKHNLLQVKINNQPAVIYEYQ